MHFTFSYIKHYFGSIKLHGVHSPFVFDLEMKCFKDKTNYLEYKQLEIYNKILLENKETILLTDLSQSAHISKNNTQKVADIDKQTSISKKKQRLLFRLTNYLNFKNTLVLGSSLSKATVALAINNKNRVTTVEGCKLTAAFAENTLKKIGCPEVFVISDTFENILNQPFNFMPDCVYIKENQTKEDILNYFYKLLPLVHNDSVLIFNDIYHSKEITKAWIEIAAHQKVTASIDTFYWGLVFFRKEQEKQSFTIRL